MKPILYITTLLLSLGVLASCTSEVSMGKQESPKQIQIIDTDEDGIPDETDNCLTIANPDQADTNGDDVGDVCEGLECEPNRCAEANQGSGSICDGDTRIECLVDVDMCVVEDQELVCTNGCEMGECSDPPSDSDAPTPPTDLSATANSSSTIDLSWTASSDNVAVTGYRVYRDGSQIAEVNGTSHTDSGLSPSTTYSYEVAAFDAVGNVSDWSSSVSATTEAFADGGAEIVGVSFDFSSHIRLAPGSDNFPTTWADDGHQYAFWGDGGGFGGTNSDGRVSWGMARIEGGFGSYSGYNVNGGKDPENSSSGINGKTHQQPISRNGALYAWVTPGSGTNGFEESRLYKSTDYGNTWSDIGVVFAGSSHGVSHVGFVQHGQNHAGPAENAGYFYLTCIELQQMSDLLGVQAPGNLFLLRVPVDEVENQSGYQWYTGSSSSPSWGSMENREPIYSESGGLGAFVQVQYVTGLDRYVMWADYGGGTSDLLLLEAPKPWGPWTEVSRVADFGSGIGLPETIFQWQLAPKWEGNGGLAFTLIFSGTGENDSWNTVDGSFQVR